MVLDMEPFFAYRFWPGNVITSFLLIMVLYSLTTTFKFLLFKASFKMTDEHRFIQKEAPKKKSKKKKEEQDKIITFPKSIRVGTVCCLIAYFLGMVFLIMAVFHICYSGRSTAFSVAYSLFGVNM